MRTHNSYRAKHVAPSLTEDDSLNSAAHLYARQLAATPLKLNLTPSGNRVNTSENLFVTYSSLPLTVQMCERKLFGLL
jgi:hypothetical protein